MSATSPACLSPWAHDGDLDAGYASDCEGWPSGELAAAAARNDSKQRPVSRLQIQVGEPAFSHIVIDRFWTLWVFGDVAAAPPYKHSIDTAEQLNRPGSFGFPAPVEPFKGVVQTMLTPRTPWFTCTVPLAALERAFTPNGSNNVFNLEHLFYRFPIGF